jgi:hypothetical protein
VKEKWTGKRRLSAPRRPYRFFAASRSTGSSPAADLGGIAKPKAGDRRHVDRLMYQKSLAASATVYQIGQLWPDQGQIPIASALAPPNTCPFSRFRPLEVSRRRPRACGIVSDDGRASGNLHKSGHTKLVRTATGESPLSAPSDASFCGSLSGISISQRNPSGANTRSTAPPSS